MSAPVVIIGTGLAAYNLAKEWRKLDSETSLLLITADDGRSYSKPMLSTGFAKNKQADELVMAEVGAMADQLNAEIRTHTQVTALEPQHKRLWMGAQSVEYRDLVLACGAEPIALQVQGDAQDAIFPLNDLGDYGRFRAACEGRSRVLIAGAGLIGCEYANDLTAAGYQVQMVAPCEQLMPNLLPEANASALQAALEQLGVQIHLGEIVQTLTHEGAALKASLSNGQVLECDVVLSAVGLRPRTQLAEAAGLVVGRGVKVDRALRTSHANIYALGDCAEVAGLNLLYVMPLMNCARALAKTLAGTVTEVSYGPMPVTVKTPACPLVVAPPAADSQGQWFIEGEGADIKARYVDAQGRLLGYALSGAAVQEKLALNKELPALLA